MTDMAIRAAKVSDRETWIERVGDKIVAEPSIDEAFQHEIDVSTSDRLPALRAAIEAAVFELDQDAIDADLMALKLAGGPELEAVLCVRGRIEYVSERLLNLLLDIRRRQENGPVAFRAPRPS